MSFTNIRTEIRQMQHNLGFISKMTPLRAKKVTLGPSSRNKLVNGINIGNYE